MEPKIIEYGGKKYALVIDNEEGECSRCVLREKCNKLPEGTLCQDEVGPAYEDTDHHRFEELKDEPLKGKLKRIRIRKDGKIDFEIATEDGQSVIAEGCALHVEM